VNQMVLFQLRKDGQGLHSTHAAAPGSPPRREYHVEPRAISNEPFRNAMAQRMARGETLSVVCRRMGWVDGRGRPETTRLRRALGMLPLEEWEDGDNCHSPRLQTSVYSDTAVLLCEALGINPTDVGI
jgi:hypothetical protein